MNVFCLSCGHQMLHSEAYCLKCGMNVTNFKDYSVDLRKASHCASCGNAVNQYSSYCPSCGADTSKISIVSSGPDSGYNSGSPSTSGSIRQNFNQVRDNLSQGKSGSIINVKNQLIAGGAKELLIPAGIFGGSAIALGLILAFLVNLFINKAFEDQIYFMLSEMFSSMDTSMPDFSSVNLLGALGVWLLSCLSGFSFKVGISAGEYGMAGFSGQITMGLLILLLLPIVALIAARFIRNRATASLFPEKQLGGFDGLCGAAFFAVANTLLLLIPLSIELFLKKSAAYITGGMGIPESALSVGLSGLILNVFLVSLTIGLLVSIPKLKVLSAQGINGDLLQQSIGTSVQLSKSLLIAGFFATAAIMLSLLIRGIAGGGAASLDNMGFVMILISIIVLIPQVTLWIVTFITGGSLTLNGSELGFACSVNAFGSDMYSMTYFAGVLLVLSGFLICLYIFGKSLKQVENGAFFKKAGMSVGFSTGILFTLTFMGNFSIFAEGQMLEYVNVHMELMNSSLMNVIFSVVIMAAAVLIIYLSRKIAFLGSIVNYLTALPSAAYYLLAVISALTVILVMMNDILTLF